MKPATVSKDFRVTIPPQVCRKLGIYPGQKLDVVAFDRLIELIPCEPVTEPKSLDADVETSIQRDDDRI